MTLSLLITECVTAVADANGYAIVLINFCADVVLFFFSFSVQRFIIFKRFKK